MSISLISQTRTIGAGASASTDTTGAKLLIACVANFGASASSASVTVSDSNSNTWHALTDHTQSNNHCAIWYAYDKSGAALVVGAGHTLTVTSANSLAETGFYSFSGTLSSASPFDVQNGAAAAGVSTLATGSITPTQAGELLISIYSSNQAVNTQTIDSGFTLIDRVQQNAGVNIGMATAYLVQGAAAAINPIWTSSGGTGNNAAAIASFKAAVGGGLFCVSLLNGLGTGGPFFYNPIG